MLTRELRALLWFFAALALAAGVLLYLLSGNTDDTFSWTIKPPLTAAFLGGAYWAAFVLFVWSARQPVWVRTRPFVLPVTVIALLLLVATLIHVDKFHKDSLFGWFWIVAYIAVPPLLVLALWRQHRAPPSPEPPRLPLPPALRSVLIFEALALVAVGISLFVAPGTGDSLWPWKLTPLTARGRRIPGRVRRRRAPGRLGERHRPPRRLGVRVRDAGVARARRRAPLSARAGRQRHARRRLRRLRGARFAHRRRRLSAEPRGPLSAHVALRLCRNTRRLVPHGRLSSSTDARTAPRR